jgi:hypothetical protein
MRFVSRSWVNWICFCVPNMVKFDGRRGFCGIYEKCRTFYFCSITAQSRDLNTCHPGTTSMTEKHLLSKTHGKAIFLTKHNFTSPALYNTNIVHFHPLL